MTDRDNRSKVLETMGLREIRQLAQKNTPPDAWEHVMGAAGSRSTLRRNQSAMRRILFRQRIFHEVTNPDTTAELFGHSLPLPALSLKAPAGQASWFS